MSKNTKALVSAPNEEAINLLRNSFPVEQGFTRVILPRLNLVSQDVTEGKGKSMKVVIEAGTFMREHESEEVDDVTGKKIWTKDELGKEVEGIILYRRKQLKYYDGTSYTSSPIYDEDNEVVRLFNNKTEIDKGTPGELRAREQYQGKSAKTGKPISKLEETRVIYVLVNGEVHQWNLRGTSMYAYMTYVKSIVAPAVLTRFSSEAKENGSISWSQATFAKVRSLDADEVADVQAHIDAIRRGITEEKAFYASMAESNSKDDDDMDALSDRAAKQLE